MSQERVDNLFASESWSAVYTAFTNVSLKAYDFDTIRDALLLYIKQTYPDKYNDFIASSEFVAVLDLVAYLGHSLSYRLDMNTRENFIDLAERKESILRLAKTLGYNKTRPINARGFMKISSVMTSEPVFDSNGVSLANRVVNWNDANDSEWYANFITVINASLNKETKIKNPKATLNISTVEHNIYEVNENTSSKSVVYGFKANVAGMNRTFEAVRAGFNDESIVELQPDRSKLFTIINRNDNLGPASDRTGFFVFTKSGKLQSTNYSYNIAMSNRIQTIATNNISNSDVWVQKLDSTGNIIREVTKVDNNTRETAIYNAIRYGSGDLVSVRTTVDNGIELHFPDGNFGNAAYGNYRVWHRVTDNESYSVDRETVKGATITIPYVGANGVTYQLTMTLNTTRDFSENFAAETMASVRRIAPRSYYAQDRMVNAQDYNVLPLSLGQNVVKKVKAVNTNFSGNSRYFEMDDITGHHSNVTVNSTDGTMYLDDDTITVKLSFNREYGNSVNFIRNEISKVIKHNSLANLYYINNIGNKNVVINTDTDELFTAVNIKISPTDPKTIEIQTNDSGTGEDGVDPYPAERMYPGDFIKIRTPNNEYWTRIYGALGSGGGISNNSYFITDILPEEQGENDFTISEIVKGFRTRFEDFEIVNIRNIAFDGSEQPNTFIIHYKHDPDSDRWVWAIHNEDDPEDILSDIHVTLKYNPGIRSSEAEYTATFSGKKVVFDSDGDVKFFYSNNKRIVDNETNLAHQDRIVIDYYDPDKSFIESSGTVQDTMSLGYSDLHNFNLEGTKATFELQYKNWTGAPTNYELINNVKVGTTQLHDSTKFVLVNSELHTDIPDTLTNINQAVKSIPKYAEYNTPIGNIGEYTLKPITIDIAELIIEENSDPVVNEPEPSNSNLYNLSDELTVLGDDGNVANAESTYITLGSVDLIYDDSKFKGIPSPEYFNRKDGSFVFVDEDKLPADQSLKTIKIEDSSNLPSGMDYADYIFRTDESSETYQFQFKNRQIEAGENNVYWKQYAYAEIEIESDRELTDDTYLVKVDDVRIDKRHTQLLETNLDDSESEVFSYKIVFWTHDPTKAEKIDIYDIKTVEDTTVYYDKLKVRADATFNIKSFTTYKTPEYASIGTYIYDNYTDSKGRVNYNKVKLSTMDSLKNPYGVLDAIKNRSLVLENKVDVEKVVNGTIQYPYNDEYSIIINVKSVDDEDKLNKDTDFIYFNNSSLKWKKFVGGEFVDLELDTDYENIIERNSNFISSIKLIKDFTIKGQNNTDIIIFESGTKFRVVPGISYLNNSLVRYNWEHFADADKRIDPSTSNIVDVYVLTADYTRRVDAWKANGFVGAIPKSPNNYELKKTMEMIKGKELISDHVTYIPVKFKALFGEQASQENQVVFKVVKKKGTLFTDSEIKSSVSAKVNEYFKLENWDFGDTFYFSELAAYLHTQLPDHISAVVVTPKYSGNQFTKLLSITSEPNEIFMSVTTSADVKIIERITDLELSGE